MAPGEEMFWQFSLRIDPSMSASYLAFQRCSLQIHVKIYIYKYIFHTDWCHSCSDQFQPKTGLSYPLHHCRTLQGFDTTIKTNTLFKYKYTNSIIHLKILCSGWFEHCSKQHAILCFFPGYYLRLQPGRGSWRCSSGIAWLLLGGKWWNPSEREQSDKGGLLEKSNCLNEHTNDVNRRFSPKAPFLCTINIFTASYFFFIEN